MKQVKANQLLFECSGRQLYAYGCVIGLPLIRPELGLDIAYSGHDDQLLRETVEQYSGYDDRLLSKVDGEEDFSAEERVELATHMIARWQAWRDAKSPR